MVNAGPWLRAGRHLPAAVFFLALMQAAASPCSARPAVSARIEKKTLRLGESFKVIVEIKGKDEGWALVLPDLAGKFKIVDQGVWPASKRGAKAYFFELVPLKSGDLEIPSFTFQGSGDSVGSVPMNVEVLPPIPLISVQGSEPLALTDGFSPKQAGLDSEVFLLAVTDKLDPYVGEQVVAEYRVYSRPAVLKGQAQGPPRFEDLTVVPMDLPDSELEWSKVSIEGVEYMAKPLARYALFPLKPGRLTVPALGYTFVTAESFESQQSVKRVSRASMPVFLDVKPLPALGRPKNFPDYNVGRYTVKASLSSYRVSVGEPVKLRVTVQGRGNIALVEAGRPRCRQGLEFLPPVTEKKTAFMGLSVIGAKTWEYGVMAKNPGKKKICGFEVAFFDPLEGQYATASSPCLVLEVEPAYSAGRRNDSVGTRHAGGDDGDGGKNPRDWRTLRWAVIGVSVALLVITAAGLAFSFRARRRKGLGMRTHRGSAGTSREHKNGRSRVETVDVDLKRMGQTPRQIRSFVLGLVEEMLGIPARGMTRDELARRAGQVGLDNEDVVRLERILERCDRSLCAPDKEMDMAGLVRDARLLARALEAISTGKSPAGPKRR